MGNLGSRLSIVAFTLALGASALAGDVALPASDPAPCAAKVLPVSSDYPAKSKETLRFKKVTELGQFPLARIREWDGRRVAAPIGLAEDFAIDVILSESLAPDLRRFVARIDALSRKPKFLNKYLRNLEETKFRELVEEELADIEDDMTKELAETMAEKGMTPRSLAEAKVASRYEWDFDWESITGEKVTQKYVEWFRTANGIPVEKPPIDPRTAEPTAAVEVVGIRLFGRDGRSASFVFTHSKPDATGGVGEMGGLIAEVAARRLGGFANVGTVQFFHNHPGNGSTVSFLHPWDVKAGEKLLDHLHGLGNAEVRLQIFAQQSIERGFVVYGHAF